MNAAELTAELRTLAERVENMRRDQLADAAEIKRLDAAVQVIQTDLALSRQRLDDHLKRVELWDTRRWGLIVAVTLAVFGVAMSFASGLLLATLRTPTK